MRVCQDHWTKLQDGIAEAGLSDLIKGSSEEAAQAAVAQFAGELTIQTFDPLMYAHNRILGNALRIGGFELLVHTNDEGGIQCPICFLNAVHEKTCDGPPCALPLKDAYEDWISLAVKDAVAARDQLLAEARYDA